MRNDKAITLSKYYEKLIHTDFPGWKDQVLKRYYLCLKIHPILIEPH